MLAKGLTEITKPRTGSKTRQPTSSYFLGRNFCYFLEGKRENVSTLLFRFDANYPPGHTADTDTTTPTKGEYETNSGQDSNLEESLNFIALFPFCINSAPENVFWCSIATRFCLSEVLINHAGFFSPVTGFV